jgi:hypothetical protein
MAKFGWAYVNARHPGPTGSVQFISGDVGETAGSENLTFVYDGDNSLLSLTGSLIVSGAIEATTMNILSTTVTEIDQQGNSNFGDSNEDVHTFSGSMLVMSGSKKLLRVDADPRRVVVRGLAARYRPITGVSDDIRKDDYIVGVQNVNQTTLTLLHPGYPDAPSGTMLVIKDETSVTRDAGAGTPNQIILTSSTGFTIDGVNSYDIEGDRASASLYSNGVDAWFIY